MHLIQRFGAPAVLLLALLVILNVFGPFVTLCVGVALLTYAYFPFGRARWIPVVAVVILMLASGVAFAADSAPETVAQATSENTKVVWAWGSMLSQGAQAVAWLLASFAMVMLRKLPANIVAIFGNARVETLLNNAINYGLNAVTGAVKDKTLSVDVGNKVLREALQYAVDNAPAWLQSWAGGPEQLAKKIWARLNLGDGADSSALPAIVDSVKTP